MNNNNTHIALIANSPVQIVFISTKLCIVGIHLNHLNEMVIFSNQIMLKLMSKMIINIKHAKYCLSMTIGFLC